MWIQKKKKRKKMIMSEKVIKKLPNKTRLRRFHLQGWRQSYKRKGKKEFGERVR